MIPGPHPMEFGGGSLILCVPLDWTRDQTVEYANRCWPRCNWIAREDVADSNVASFCGIHGDELQRIVRFDMKETRR